MTINFSHNTRFFIFEEILNIFSLYMYNSNKHVNEHQDKNFTSRISKVIRESLSESKRPHRDSNEDLPVDEWSGTMNLLRKTNRTVWLVVGLPISRWILYLKNHVLINVRT